MKLVFRMIVSLFIFGLWFSPQSIFAFPNECPENYCWKTNLSSINEQDIVLHETVPAQNTKKYVYRYPFKVGILPLEEPILGFDMNTNLLTAIGFQYDGIAGAYVEQLEKQHGKPMVIKESRAGLRLFWIGNETIIHTIVSSTKKGQVVTIFLSREDIEKKMVHWNITKQKDVDYFKKIDAEKMNSQLCLKYVENILGYQ